MEPTTRSNSVVRGESDIYILLCNCRLPIADCRLIFAHTNSTYTCPRLLDYAGGGKHVTPANYAKTQQYTTNSRRRDSAHTLRHSTIAPASGACYAVRACASGCLLLFAMGDSN